MIFSNGQTCEKSSIKIQHVKREEKLGEVRMRILWVEMHGHNDSRPLGSPVGRNGYVSGNLVLDHMH